MTDQPSMAAPSGAGGESDSDVPGRTKGRGFASKALEAAHASRLAVLVLKRRDQVVFATTCLIALFSIAAYCAKTSHWRGEPIELDRQVAHELDYRIELNGASW